MSSRFVFGALLLEEQPFLANFGFLVATMTFNSGIFQLTDTQENRC